MIVKIGGEVVNYQANSIDYDDNVGQRSAASFGVVDPLGTMQFKKGQPVEIYEENEYGDPGALVFGGVIDRPVSRYLSLAGNGKIHQITCADQHYIADKRIVAKLYREVLAGDIVKDLINSYLIDEGVTAGEIQNGPVVIEAVFNYISFTQCMESLAEKAGFEWEIDAHKKLHFFARETFRSNEEITETSNIKNVEVEPESAEYRNRQYVRAGKDMTDPQTERFKGDGSRQTFTVGFQIAQVPTIFLNGVEIPRVGIRGLEEGLQFYWSKGSNEITQDEDAEPLTADDELEITYRGFVDIVALSYDADAVAEMKAIEGGTGLHEHVIDDPHITSRQSAFETANAKLRRYARIGRKITFDTQIKGFKAGQLVRVKLDSYGIDDDYLIESIQANELGSHDGRLVYRISAVDGAASGGWAKFFKDIATRGQAFVIRENIRDEEVLALLELFQKTWLHNDRVNIFRKTYPGANTFPGNDTMPSFTDENRVKFMVLFDENDKEILRKTATIQTEANEGMLVTTVYVAPYEANDVEIKSVGWYGGTLATEEPGTGVLVDKQPFEKTKTDMESIQIDKTDIKGW